MDKLRPTSLSGTEIIEDIVSQIRGRLSRNCDLRGTDAYSAGFSASIDIKIKCYGLDKVEVNSEFTIGTDQPDPDAVVEESMDIPQETNLNLVRERIEEAKDDAEQQHAEADDEGEQPVVKNRKRKYVRRLKIGQLPPAEGGAVSIED